MTLPEPRLPFLTASVWRAWEEHAVTFEDGPHLLPEVVAALIALPEDQVRIRRILVPPAAWQELRGTVFGVRFRMVGQFDGRGYWSHVWDLVPLVPGEEEVS